MISNERQNGSSGRDRHASVPKPSDRQEGQETVRDRRGATPREGLPCHPLDDHQESLWRARSHSSLRFVPGSENPEQDATRAEPRTLSGTRGSSRQGVETLSDRSHCGTKGTAFFPVPGDGSRTERVQENWLERGSDDQKQGSGRGRRVPEIGSQGL